MAFARLANWATPQTGDDKMFRCILCRSNHDDSARSLEHVFPEAMGGTLASSEMCKPCNDFLGHSADALLVNHFLIKMDRQRFCLAGKAGNVPNPFARGTLHERDGVSRVSWERGGYLYRFPSARVIQGRTQLRLDPRDATKVESIRRRAEARRGPRGIPLEVSVAGPDRHSTTSFPIDTSMDGCQRALVKITYEVAALLLGERYLQTPKAAAVRDYLLRPTTDVAAIQRLGRFLDCGHLSPLAGAGEALLIGGVVSTPGMSSVSYVRIFDRCEFGLFLPEDSCVGLSPDGSAVVIDVSVRRQPLRTTLRELGWFVQSKTN